MQKRYFQLHKILENKFAMSENVKWSFFVLLKLTLLSQKMKIWNHTILVNNERFVEPRIPLILYKTVQKKNQSNRFLRKTMDPGGALKYFWSPISGLIRVASKSGFRWFASLLMLFQIKYIFDAKVKTQFSPFWWRQPVWRHNLYF